MRAVLPATGITNIDRGSISDGGTCVACGPGQHASWTLGDLPPGRARSVSLPLTVVTGQRAPADLTELTTMVSATATGSAQVVADATVVVDRDRALALALDADHERIPSGGALRYRLTVGNRGVTPVATTTLRMAVPPGTSFVSASDGAAPAGGIVEWPLGDLGAGASGVRELVVHVDALGGQVIAGEPTVDRAEPAIRGRP